MCGVDPEAGGDEPAPLRGLCPSVSSRMVPIALEVAGSFVSWLCLYCCLCRLNPRRSCKWSCHLVTLVHGLLVTCLSGYVLFLDGPWPLTHAGTVGIPPPLYLCHRCR